MINVREIGDLATMPGKEELFSKLLFLINSPAQRLATVINATGRDLAVVINQGVEKGKFAGSAAPAAEAKAEVAEAPVAEAAVRQSRPHMSKSPRLASSLREQHSRKTPPLRRVGKPRPLIRSKDKAG